MFKDVLQEMLEFDLKIFRDRKAEFEPTIISKHSRDIHDQIFELYGSRNLRRISE